MRSNIQNGQDDVEKQRVLSIVFVGFCQVSCRLMSWKKGY